VPLSSPLWRAKKRCAAPTKIGTAPPITSPPIATTKKVRVVSTIENMPVTAAATANRKQTRPVASLSRASPSSTCIIVRGTGVAAVIAETATGSVGESTAASAKATGSGMLGINQSMK
jgi:hypothetical protein